MTIEQHDIDQWIPRTMKERPDPQTSNEQVSLLESALLQVRLALGLSRDSTDDLREVAQRLTARVAELEAGAKAWNPVYEVVLNERDRLRAALRKIVSESCMMGTDRGHSGIEGIALAALGERPAVETSEARK